MQHKVVIFSKYLAKKCYPLPFTYFYIVRDPYFVVRSLDFICKRPRSGGGAQPTVFVVGCAKINKKNRHFKASIFAFSPPEKSGRKALMCNVLDMLKIFSIFLSASLDSLPRHPYFVRIACVLFYACRPTPSAMPAVTLCPTRSAERRCPTSRLRARPPFGTTARCRVAASRRMARRGG